MCSLGRVRRQTGSLLGTLQLRDFKRVFIHRGSTEHVACKHKRKHLYQDTDFILLLHQKAETMYCSWILQRWRSLAQPVMDFFLPAHCPLNVCELSPFKRSILVCTSAQVSVAAALPGSQPTPWCKQFGWTYSTLNNTCTESHLRTAQWCNSIFGFRE